MPMFAAIAAVPARATPTIAAPVIREVLPASDFFEDCLRDEGDIGGTIRKGERALGQRKAKVW